MRKLKRLFILSLCVTLFFTNGCSKEKEQTSIVTVQTDDSSQIYNDDTYVFGYNAINPDGDEDNDGLTNEEEKELGTDMFLSDTDNDTISDYDEINTTKTDPLKADTDGDGLNDAVEILAGLDPLNAKSDGNTLDAERTFEEKYEIENCALTVEGNANVTDVYVSKVEYIDVSKLSGVVSDLYEFYMDDMNFKKATLMLTYDDNIVNNYHYNENTLSIYQYLNDGSLQKVESVLDKENNTLTAELTHFSKYVIADSENINENPQTQVFILMDNSGSMYPAEMCESSDENDVDFKRIDFAKTLIERTNENVVYGLAKFTATYKELNRGFDNSKEDLYASLESIKTTPENFNGTYIASSIMSSLKNFDYGKKNKKFIIILTDGATTEGTDLFSWSFYDESDAIQEALERNVSIITIGLGNSIDEAYLQRIANDTGGMYVYANNADALDRVYDMINAKINNGYVDLDNDGEFDSILIADNGFDVTKDGFSFDNYIIEKDKAFTEGQCYGMAMFVQLYYKGKVPVSNDVIPSHNTSLKGHFPDSKSYNFNGNTFFTSNGNGYLDCRKNLYDYNIYEDAISLIVNSKPRYERENEDSLRYIKPIREAIDQYDILTYNYYLSAKNATFTDDKPYKKYQYYSYNLDYTINNNTSQEERDIYGLLTALNNMYSQQGTNNVDSYMDGAYTEDDDEKSFSKLITDLQNGIVPIVCQTNHAVSAIRLYRDIENPLEYKLIVYDNNDAGIEKSITIKRINRKDKDALIIVNGVHKIFNEYGYYFYDTDNIFGRNGGEVSISFNVSKILR